MIKIQCNRERVEFQDLPDNESAIVIWPKGEQSLVIKIPKVEDKSKRYNAYDFTRGWLCYVSPFILVEKVDLEIKVL